MNRRQFARNITGAALSSAVLGTPLSANAEHTPPAQPTPPFPLSVMLWTVSPKLPFEQRLEKVAEAGYHAVELVSEYKDWSGDDFKRVKSKRDSLGLTFDAMAGLHKGLANPADRDAFLAELTSLLPIAEKLECRGIIVLSGNATPGLTRDQQHQSCIEGLKRAADLASRKNVTLLLENIDPEENPRYYLTSVGEGFEIIRRVAHPKVKFLYDFYHEQLSEGNLIEKLEKNIDQVGLVHVADVPGRHAPGTGEINYANIYRKLAQLKFNRYVAMEFIATGDVVAELRTAREMVERSAVL
jgi:hydroxypyruvate isomerase